MDVSWLISFILGLPVAVLASAIFAGDPAREIICTAERPVWQVVLSRLSIVLGLLVVMALSPTGVAETGQLR